MSMRMKICKRSALLMALVMMTLCIWSQDVTVATAATPAFKYNNITFKAIGKKYQLFIRNWIPGSRYQWYSTNKKVVKVSSKGVIKSVGVGKAYVKCKITFPRVKSRYKVKYKWRAKTQTLACKVTVCRPTTSIKISNARIVDGAHTMTVGERYTFNSSLVPANTTYATYWSTGSVGDPSCIEINPSTGLVTAKKAGTVTLVATAARTSTQAAAATSKIKDQITIKVVDAAASVKSAQIISPTEMKVEFDNPIDKNTVIGAYNVLLDSIDIIVKKNAKGALSADPGKLTASLSADLKTLTITAANRFEGNYAVEFTDRIKTTSGVAIKEYYKRLSYMDTSYPTVTSVSLDESGMINVINFSEAMDFSNMKVSNASLVRTANATTSDPSTIATLNNVSNYTPSADKKSLTVNLSRISSADYNKTFSVAISGVKDLVGNYPQNYTLTVQMRTDTTAKTQAVPFSVTRSAHNMLTAEFNRAIQKAGWATINGGSTIYGEVDSKNNKKVNYTIPNASIGLTGNVTVNLGDWNAYNVVATDRTAQQGKRFTINFTPDRVNPVLLSGEYDPQNQILTLTYNEKVDLAKNTDVLSTTLVTVSDDIRPGTNITYTKADSTDEKVIKVKLTNMTALGRYTITMNQGFVKDSYSNDSDKKTITINNVTGSSTELPAPKSVKQSTTDPNQIYVEFANKLDVTSAQQLSNYSIPGVTIASAQVTKNTADNGATVVLTVADGSITVSVERPVTISGIKGYNGSYSAMSVYTVNVDLRENQKPQYIAPLAFDRNQADLITMKFSEDIKGTLALKVAQQNGYYPRDIANSVSIAGNIAYIKLNEVPERNSYLQISVINNNLTDNNGNPVTLGNLSVQAAY